MDHGFTDSPIRGCHTFPKSPDTLQKNMYFKALHFVTYIVLEISFLGPIVHSQTHKHKKHEVISSIFFHLRGHLLPEFLRIILLSIFYLVILEIDFLEKGQSNQTYEIVVDV